MSRERDLLLAAFLADQADHDLGRAEALERQQALVHVADLLDGQRAERDRAPLPRDRDRLHRPEHVQHRPVVHRQREPRVAVRRSNSDPSCGDQPAAPGATTPR